jgi:hypothetical protein
MLDALLKAGITAENMTPPCRDGSHQSLANVQPSKTRGRKRMPTAWLQPMARL